MLKQEWQEAGEWERQKGNTRPMETLTGLGIVVQAENWEIHHRKWQSIWGLCPVLRLVLFCV